MRSPAAGAARHIARCCPKTAAEGCYVCEDFQSAPQFLPIHQDALVRTRELQADAEVNARLATGVEHLITRITAAEHDHLQPSTAEEQANRTADDDMAEDTADASG